jgi:hypothetical protein
MADIRVAHVFECSPEIFWEKIFFDVEFNRTMYMEGLGFSSWKELETRELDDTLQRVVEIVPPVGDLPGPLRKLIGDGFGYREEGSLDKKSQRYQVKAIPSRLADKIKVEGVLWCEPEGESSCRRFFEGTVEAKIFGVGGLLENRIIADMRRNYDDAADYTRKYLASLATK